MNASLRSKAMFGYILATIALAVCVSAQEGEVIVPDNKTQCIVQMVQWCSAMKYPQQGIGMAMLSITYVEPSGYYRVFCSSDTDGTNCTKNGQPWFSCTPEQTMTYNGKVLTNSSKDVDDGICNTADKAFNELFVQNLSYDNTTLKMEMEKGMESFFAQIAAMQEQIEQLQRRLQEIPMFGGDFWSGFEDEFLFAKPESTTDVARQNSTEQSNQIEKE